MVPIQSKGDTSSSLPPSVIPAPAIASKNQSHLPCARADRQNPQSPITKSTATTGTNQGSIPMVAIPKDVSTPPAAAAHTAHLASGTKAARPLLNIPTDLRNAFIGADQVRQLSAFLRLVLCLDNS